MPAGLVQGAACSCKRESEVASGVRIPRRESNCAIEKLPCPHGTTKPEFQKRAADAGPGELIAPHKPRGVRHEPQLTVVTRAGLGDGEEVVSGLRSAIGISARSTRATAVSPAAERLFDLPL